MGPTPNFRHWRGKLFHGRGRSRPSIGRPVPPSRRRSPTKAQRSRSLRHASSGHFEDLQTVHDGVPFGCGENLCANFGLFPQNAPRGGFRTEFDFQQRRRWTGGIGTRLVDTQARVGLCSRERKWESKIWEPFLGSSIGCRTTRMSRTLQMRAQPKESPDSARLHFWNAASPKRRGHDCAGDEWMSATRRRKATPTTSARHRDAANAVCPHPSPFLPPS